MANMIMASYKMLITPSIPPTPKPKLIHHQSLPKITLPKFLKHHQLPSLLAAAATFSLSAEIKKAALFDFNLTLPIIALEFLFLMVALDKIYYTPLGKFMDESDREYSQNILFPIIILGKRIFCEYSLSERDAAIREKLNGVKDISAEVKDLEDQAAAVMKAARAEISAALNRMRKETQIEEEEKLAEGRKKVEAELQEALASLEKQKEEALKALEPQIPALSEAIVKKVLPFPEEEGGRG